MKYLRAIGLTLVMVLGFGNISHAATGTIDPRGVGNWKALMENTSLSAAPTINFGKFTTQSAYNITVSDTELRGHVWGEGVGWIITNCADTTSGCSSTNSNFKVANDGTGNLSGYAWGQNTGWINFGPFTNPLISTVKITNGFFGGTLGDAGYAWVQNYGWMKFECPSTTSCVETDWGVTTPSGGGGGGNISQCSDGLDNADPEDALADVNDPGCHSDGDAANLASYQPSDNDETSAVCSDRQDNDNDGAIDYPADPGCDSYIDMDEYNVPTTPPNPTCEDGIKNQHETGRDTGGECTMITPPNGTPPQCSDRQDNDNDGAIDYPADPGCDSYADNDESNTKDDTPPTKTFCELYPSLCFTLGTPSNPSGPTTPIVPSPSNPFIRSVTAVGLAFPIMSAIVSFVTGNPIVLKDVPLLFGQGWSAFLIAIGWKKPKKPWGVVYDSVTKHPIDPAYVVLTDLSGNEIATAITDINGRYGFAVDPGTYRILVNKTNYAFPSTRLASKTSDDLYDELYFGGDVVVQKDGEIITKNIPLDAIAFDWNEYAKSQKGGTYNTKLAFYRTSDIFLHHLSTFMFYLGFALSIYAIVFFLSLWNAIVFAFYIIMSLVRMFSQTFHKKGSVLSRSTKQPVPFAVVRLVSTTTNTEVAHKVADRIGNYYGLVQNGTYAIVIDTAKQPEGYDKYLIAHPVNVKKGYLKEKFKI